MQPMFISDNRQKHFVFHDDQGFAEPGPDEPQEIVASGDSSSGAIPVHMMAGEQNELIYVSPYHYYRVPMADAVLFPLALDDSPVVPEGGNFGQVHISQVELLDETSFRIYVEPPAGVQGNWILSMRTVSKAYEFRGVHYPERSRTVQFRISTRPPIEKHIADLQAR